LDSAMLSVQQAIVSGDNQPGTVGAGHRLPIMQKAVHLEDALDLMQPHLPVGPSAPPHRW
jgi:hypothetical protein